MPNRDRQTLELDHVKDIQLLPPLFEFSGACAGCGETPYLKLLSQLFGDRTLIGNATGCSSIYGGNLPTTPWTVNREGRGPAWSNSLFEDNAEFGLGMRLALDKQAEYARELLTRLSATVGDDLVQGLLDADQATEAGIQEQRQRVSRSSSACKEWRRPRHATCSLWRTAWSKRVSGSSAATAGPMTSVMAVWITCSLPGTTSTCWCSTPKSIPTPAVRCPSPRRGRPWPSLPLAAKQLPKKDLAAMAMTYGNVYVAQVAMGGNDTHTVKAFLEAESYNGPSLLIAYSHCIAHGYDLVHGMEQQKAAVLSGHWPLFRYDPRLVAQGKNPFQLDSRPPSLPLQKYAYNETRYTMLVQSKPEVARQLLHEAQEDVAHRWRLYEHWATPLTLPSPPDGGGEGRVRGGNGARKEKQA